jgi:hypothetical protein
MENLLEHSRFMNAAAAASPGWEAIRLRDAIESG